jgi:hypothetical protein
MRLPDESCRKCGGVLIEYSICAKCKSSNQFICRTCGMLTLQQYHTLCFNEAKPIEGLLVIGV